MERGQRLSPSTLRERSAVFSSPAVRQQRELARGKHVFLIEDPLYFRQCAFHEQKLILHRALMRMHASFLRKSRIDVEVNQGPTMASVMERVRDLPCERVHVIDPVDDWLERRVTREAKYRQRLARAEQFLQDAPL